MAPVSSAAALLPCGHADVCDTVPFALDTQIVMDNLASDEAFVMHSCKPLPSPSLKPSPEPDTHVKRQLFPEGPGVCAEGLHTEEVAACTEPVASGATLPKTSSDLSSKLLHQPTPQKKHCSEQLPSIEFSPPAQAGIITFP